MEDHSRPHELIVVLDFWGRLPLGGGRIAGSGVGPDAMLHVLIRAWNGALRVLALHPDGWHTELPVEAQEIAFDLVQPLDDGLVLASSRSANAAVFDPSGHLAREFVLGNGIADMQTTADGRIWVSYHDQSVFPGNSRFRPTHLPGLVLFDRTGEAQFGLWNQIVDCYCLNVTDDHTCGPAITLAFRSCTSRVRGSRVSGSRRSREQA